MGYWVIWIFSGSECGADPEGTHLTMSRVERARVWCKPLRDVDAQSAFGKENFRSAARKNPCRSDRRGHIFASDEYLADVWMYTAQTNTWSRIPMTPFAHSDGESCTVSADGWLYYGTNNGEFARLKIF